MRSLWKGSISFGLVNIPARLYAATEERDVHFRLLHRACGLPLRQRRHHPACQVDVEAGDVVRGFEYAPGAFALVEDEDLEALPLPTEKAVQIVSFVRAEAVDPILHHRSYFVELAVGGVKAYSLLRATLAEAGRVALAKMASASGNPSPSSASTRAWLDVPTRRLKRTARSTGRAAQHPGTIASSSSPPCSGPTRCAITEPWRPPCAAWR